MSVIKDLFAKDSLHTSAAAHTGINKKCQHISVFYRYYSTSVVSMLLFFSSCIVSYDLLSPWVPRSVCVCVCDTLSSWCSLTVFPVEQNKPLPQGFLVSKYRPQRIILKDCRVPKVVLQFTRVSL